MFAHAMIGSIFSAKTYKFMAKHHK